MTSFAETTSAQADAEHSTWKTPLPEVTAKPESALANWATHSLIQCKRLLLVWARDPATTIQTLVYPALTLWMFQIVLGRSISGFTHQPSIYAQVSLLTLVAAMSGAVVSALGFKGEKMTGLLGRFWTMPIHRAAGLTGRLLAEAVRVLVTTLFVIGVGLLLGFRFLNGPLAGLALIGIPVLFGVAFAVLVTALATITEGVMLVNVIGIINTLLMFFNTGFAPAFAYPMWLQSTVQNQPMSCAIDAMRGLSYGGPVAEPLMKTLLWTVGLIVVCTYPAIRGYRRAAETGA
ncbi:peptide ABC transporter permease [Nocardia brasiliensis]|uniref:Transport permease protein n=1 Tax=Nocardia brasiliensis TaxID=37326 RepID=A0A6G9XL64_NOCBR|nr:ABC transporter permease [Nocardia brasiliensis]QIS01623.1 peptide ABC transporter permease [Nocardia brasiliensis]